VYRKTTDFCKLILYTTILLKLFMVSRCFGVGFFASLRYRIMSSANRDTLTISLPICIPSVSPFCFTALAKNSRTMLDRSEESEHPCLVLDLGEMVSVFPH
jgi:hypothetical protein